MFVQKMNEGFKKVPVSDPSKLTNFIEGTSGSVLAILSVKLIKSDIMHFILNDISPEFE